VGKVGKSEINKLKTVSARAMRHQDSQSLPSHHHCFELVNFTFPHFTHTGAPQCLCVGVGGCVRAQSARACVLSARAMRHQDSQSLSSHHHCFELVNFTFPHFIQGQYTTHKCPFIIKRTAPNVYFHKSY
jgi:hypothetical protein